MMNTRMIIRPRHTFVNFMEILSSSRLSEYDPEIQRDNAPYPSFTYRHLDFLISGLLLPARSLAVPPALIPIHPLALIKKPEASG
jgi:hypothetical protein